MKIDVKIARDLTTVRGHYAPALIGPIELDAFHGEPDESEDEEIYWLTTDENHAAVFGEVTEYELEFQLALVLDAKRDIRLRRLDGPRADDRLRKILQHSPAHAAIVLGWEGKGLVVLLSSPL